MEPNQEQVKKYSRGESYIHNKWRPAAAWFYLIICLFDFLIFPILWIAVQMTTGVAVLVPWNPMTLQGAGLFHIAFGAFIGITSFGRSREKIAGVE